LSGVRRSVAVLVLAAGLAAGCSGPDGPTDFAVTTPPASATAAAPASQTPAPRTTAPVPSPAGTAPDATGTAPGATGTAPGATAAGGPLQAYLALSGRWATARGAFFTAVSDGSPRTVAQQRALAAAFLLEQRAFGAAVRAGRWPDAARPAVTAFLARNAAQEATVAAMARAGSRGEFTARLADYGTATAAETAAIRAVTTALR
jgi:hypothetical protein